jgi:hypothetical protein
LKWVGHKFIMRRGQPRLSSTPTNKDENAFKGLNDKIASGCDRSNDNWSASSVYLNRRFTVLRPRFSDAFQG